MDDIFKKLNIGAEVECVGPDPEFTANHLRYRIRGLKIKSWSLSQEKNQGEGWIISRDRSQGKFGIELSTPILNTENLDILDKILLNFHPNYYKVNKKSGMHLHFSNKISGCINFDKFSHKIIQEYGKLIWTTRLRFCKPVVQPPIADKYYSRHYAVHHVIKSTIIPSNRVEVRIFNGTLNYNVIEKRIKEVADIYLENVIG